MSAALQTVRTLRPAQAEVRVCQTILFALPGGLAPQAEALGMWWSKWRWNPHGQQMVCWRGGRGADWRPLRTHDIDLDFVQLMPPALSPSLPRWLEVASEAVLPGKAARASLLIQDLPSVRDVPRCSMVLMRLPDDTAPADIIRLGESFASHLKVSWGTSGWAFQHVSGPPDVAGMRMASMARRCWGIQLLDLGGLQWDAPRGLPSVNWLTWLSPEFAASLGVDLSQLVQHAGVLKAEHVHVRNGQGHVAFAAGARPLRGDVNLGEDIRPYMRVSELLSPLLLKTATPLAGPLARAEVLASWLQRFEAPDPWRRARVDLD